MPSPHRVLGLSVLAVAALASAAVGAEREGPAGRIVFVSDLTPAAAAPGRRMNESRIHSVSVDGALHVDVTRVAEIGSDSAVSVSPDRRMMAFLRTRRGTDVAELWIADADGSNARRLLAPGPAESFTNSDSEPYFHAPAWSPRGETIALDVVSTATCGPGHETKCASWYTTLVGLDGRRRDAGGVNARWSPTGAALLVRGGLFGLEDASEWDLGVIRADGAPLWDVDPQWKRPEACWTDGSWSPAGTRVVLTESRCDGSARRLHVVDARDGTRLAVVRGCCAAWSPDGRRLAYVAFRATGNELVIATSDGRRPRRVARDATLVGWAPRGNRLAFLRQSDGRGELVLTRGDASHPRAVARSPHGGLEAAGWSSDGLHFAYFRREHDRAQLLVARGDGSHARVLARREGRVLTNGSWSPDSRHLVFWDTREGTDSRLTAVDAASGRTRTSYRAREGAYSFVAGWTGNRTALVLETAGGTYPEELWSVRPDGSGLRRLTRNARGELDPAWSPDGSRIAFWRDDPKRGRKPEDLSVYVMRADGRDARKLIGGPRGSFASHPDWSPDGRSLAVVRWPDANHTDVWIVRQDGTGQRRLTRTGHGHAPAWAPDGQSIAFSDDGAAKVVALDGTRPTALLDPAVASYCSGFAWAPDGRTLASACQIPGLILTRPDGSDVHGVDRNGVAPSWSPDGQWLVYEADGLRIVRVDGGESIALDLRGASARQPDWSPR